MIAPPPFLAAWLKPVRPLTAARIIRKARQEASKRGEHTRWRNAGERARAMFEGVGG